MNTNIFKQVSQLPWSQGLVASLVPDTQKSNEVRHVEGITHSYVDPTPVAQPQLLGWATRCAQLLGVVTQMSDVDHPSLLILGGQAPAPGVRPFATRYGGHQFGVWAGQLGDGRAIHLGEVGTPHGPQELQLKGAGPTPYARGGDGRAVLRSSVREFLCSEAMAGLGIPTTRALSLVATGEGVVRDMFYDGRPQVEPGAIVCRVAPTFLRFGHVQIHFAHGEWDLLKTLLEGWLRRHCPQFLGPQGPQWGPWFAHVAGLTGHLIAQWMAFGFVHGVMNTDNMSLLGLTLDFGPYGWMEPFDPQWTPNTSDRLGRYAYGNQPHVGQWNVAQLGHALSHWMEEKDIIQGLEVYTRTYSQTVEDLFYKKLGLNVSSKGEDPLLLPDLLQLLEMSRGDFTLFFRNLCDWDPLVERGTTFANHFANVFYGEDGNTGELPPAARGPWENWMERYGHQSKNQGVGTEQRRLGMKATNPKFIFRNYLAVQATQALLEGDGSLLQGLLTVLQDPFDDHLTWDHLAQPRPPWAATTPGCAQLSCSS